MYRSGVFTTISFWIVAVLVAFLPVFFLPGSWGGISAAKSLLLYGGVITATMFWLLAQFSEGSIVFPKHRIVAVLGGWVLAVLASTLASANTQVSLWGRGFALDSFMTVLVLGLLAFLVGSYARAQKRLAIYFLASFIGLTATVVLQVVFFLVRSPALTQIAQTGSIVGSWVDFAYTAAITLIVALLSYEVLAPKGILKILAVLSMVLSTVVLVFLNFKTAWLIVLVAALLVFVYKASVERSIAHRTSRFPMVSFGVLMVAVFFFITASTIGVRISSLTKLPVTDIRPSVSATFGVVGHSLRHDPVFGAGPGRFAQLWDLYRPAAINQTAFWDASFDAGSGTIPTLFATHGGMAAILLIVLIGYSVVCGFRLFGGSFPDRFSRFIATASLIMLSTIVLLMSIATPGIVLVAYCFFYMGMLVGVSQLIGTTSEFQWQYLKDPRKSFLIIGVIVVGIILCVGGLYATYKTYASIRYFNKALVGKDVVSIDTYLGKALQYAPNDVYWRARTALYTEQFVASAGQSTTDKAALQQAFTSLEQTARAAVSWDPTDASNWASLARVYQLVSTQGNLAARDGWRDAAATAHAKAPTHPLYVMLQAYSAMVAKDYQEALDYYTQARTLALNNPDAWIGMIDALTALDRRTEALALLDQFAQVFPTIKGVDAKRESIQPLSPTPTPATSKR